MADDSSIKMIAGLAVVGIGAYWLYNNFLLPAAVAATPVPATTPPATTTTAVTTTAPAVVTTPAGPCNLSNTLAPLLKFAQAAQPTLSLGPTGSDGLTMDQWCYYGSDVCSNMCAQAGLDPGVIFPNDAARGGVLNWNAFEGYAVQKGLSGYRRCGLGTNLVRRAA
jgi:hypothetical protein